MTAVWASDRGSQLHGRGNPITKLQAVEAIRHPGGLGRSTPADAAL